MDSFCFIIFTVTLPKHCYTFPTKHQHHFSMVDKFAQYVLFHQTSSSAGVTIGTDLTQKVSHPHKHIIGSKHWFTSTSSTLVYTTLYGTWFFITLFIHKTKLIIQHHTCILCILPVYLPHLKPHFHQSHM